MSLVVIVTTGGRTSRLLTNIEGGHYPAILMTRDLGLRLKDIHAGFQTATAFQETSDLGKMDKLRDEFLADLDSQRENQTLAAGAIDALSPVFRAYYDLARDVTERLVTEEMTGQLIGDIQTMTERHHELEAQRSVSETRAVCQCICATGERR